MITKSSLFSENAFTLKISNSSGNQYI